MGHAGSETERVWLDQCISLIPASLLLISFVGSFHTRAMLRILAKTSSEPGLLCTVPSLRSCSLCGKPCLQGRSKAGWTRLPLSPSLLQGLGKPTPCESWLQPRGACQPSSRPWPCQSQPRRWLYPGVRQKWNPCIMNKSHVQHFKCLFMSPDN